MRESLGKHALELTRANLIKVGSFHSQSKQVSTNTACSQRDAARFILVSYPTVARQLSLLTSISASVIPMAYGAMISTEESKFGCEKRGLIEATNRGMTAHKGSN